MYPYYSAPGDPEASSTALLASNLVRLIASGHTSEPRPHVERIVLVRALVHFAEAVVVRARQLDLVRARARSSAQRPDWSQPPAHERPV